MRKLSQISFRALAAATALITNICALALLPTQKSAAQTAGDSVIYLNQAWSQADRETYYQTSQGSQVISYDIFLNLEVAGGQELFRSDANSDRYGLVPQAPNPRTNPDGLPVGLTKTVLTEGPYKGEMVGVTCAACHNAQLYYQGKKVRIDGGFNHTFDFMSYVNAFDDAMQATLTDASKFDRLATRLQASSAEAKTALRKRFETEAARVHSYRTVTLATPVIWGPGRIDAFNLITSRMLATETGIGENWSAPMAPVKPPFVWNAPQGSWTQWAASVQDPLPRNHGETLGVFASMDFRSKSPKDGLFDTSAQIANLQKIEHLLDRLAPPKWPEEVLGKIDRKKAAQGKALFATHCASCHNSYPYTWTEPNKYGKRFIQVGLVPQTYVGTDPAQFDSTQAYALTGHLSEYLPPPLKGQAIVPTPELRKALVVATVRKALDAMKISDADRLDLNGYRQEPLPPAPERVWKAAPRDGVWATGPFLHNGSVPNLYEMLLPASQRSKKFNVGREFDPIKVGIDTSGKSGSFVFDTSLYGNSNAGHSFQNGPRGNGVIGPLLTDAQRWALVEYLKSIPEKDAQVSPFGGPPNAKSGNPPWANVPPVGKRSW
jgi:RoxA-like, cytochrome c-like